MGFHKEFRSQVTVGEIPEMVTVYKCIRNRQKYGFFHAVACQSERGDTGHVDGSAAAQHGVEDIIFRTENTAGLNVDGDLPAGELFYLLLERGCHLSDDGV